MLNRWRHTPHLFTQSHRAEVHNSTAHLSQPLEWLADCKTFKTMGHCSGYVNTVRAETGWTAKAHNIREKLFSRNQVGTTR
jgi:hypothetical protein